MFYCYIYTLNRYHSHISYKLISGDKFLELKINYEVSVALIICCHGRTFVMRIEMLKFDSVTLQDGVM